MDLEQVMAAVETLKAENARLKAEIAEARAILEGLRLQTHSAITKERELKAEMSVLGEALHDALQPKVDPA